MLFRSRSNVQQQETPLTTDNLPGTLSLSPVCGCMGQDALYVRGCLMPTSPQLEVEVSDVPRLFQMGTRRREVVGWSWGTSSLPGCGLGTPTGLTAGGEKVGLLNLEGGGGGSSSRIASPAHF